MASEEGAAAPLALSETLAGRLCHDISGLLGALLGTIELAQEEDAAGEALGLAVDSARELAGRLRLLRTAWGAPSAELDAAAMAELLSHAAGRPRARTDLSGMAPGRFEAERSRLLLNVALTGLESLPGGGVVRMFGGPGQDVVARLEGARAAWPAGWIGAVAGSAELAPPTTRTLQPAVTLLAARAGGARLSWLFGPADAPPALLIAA